MSHYKLRDHLFNGAGEYPFKFVLDGIAKEVNLVVDKFGHFELADAPSGLYAIASYRQPSIT